MRINEFLFELLGICWVMNMMYFEHFTCEHKSITDPGESFKSCKLFKVSLSEN